MGAVVSLTGLSLGQERPSFFGKDSSECEQFIADVAKYAYNRGKQRDNEWIADFVGTCLREDALRWWAGLDDATQGNWKALQRALFFRYGPVFFGESGEEAERFVFSIRQRARDAGKLEDPQWIAAYASPFFAGGALRWYSLLQPNVRKNWDVLQTAIFIQYPREDGDGVESSIFPTASSAILTGPSLRTRRRGYIKLIRSGDSKTYYLSINRHASGYLRVEASLENALEVEYHEEDDLDEPRTLYIPDNQVANYDVLGIKWNGSSAPTSSWAGLCPIESSSGDGSWKSEGLAVTDPWKISPKLKGEVTICVMNGSARMHASSTGTGGGLTFHKDKPASNVASVFFEEK